MPTRNQIALARELNEVESQINSLVRQAQELATHIQQLKKINASADEQLPPQLCVNGHEYTPENTYLDKYDHRRCRTCRAERQTRWRSKMHEELN